jgi:ubiquinone/menaquinone biosynthesis C-methylase UbiE
MRRPQFIAQQSAKPEGILGRIIAFIMERETADQNRRALDALAIEDGDDVLELGYGHGRTLETIASLTPSGAIAGIDHSEQMREVATRRCDSSLGTGRVDIKNGDTRHLPYPDGSFSCALAVHLVYFWHEPVEHLREVHRVLRENGRFVLAFRDKKDPSAANFPAPLYTFHAGEEVRRMLAEAGFRSIETIDDAPDFTILFARR